MDLQSSQWFDNVDYNFLNKFFPYKVAFLTQQKAGPLNDSFNLSFLLNDDWILKYLISFYLKTVSYHLLNFPNLILHHSLSGGGGYEVSVNCLELYFSVFWTASTVNLLLQ